MHKDHSTRKPTRAGPSANKREADRFAQTVAPVIRELRAEGIVAQSAIAQALNQRHVETARGGKWHRTSVLRLLNRLRRSQVAIAGWGTALAIVGATGFAFGDFI